MLDLLWRKINGGGPCTHGSCVAMVAITHEFCLTITNMLETAIRHANQSQSLAISVAIQLFCRTTAVPCRYHIISTVAVPAAILRVGSKCQDTKGSMSLQGYSLRLCDVLIMDSRDSSLHSVPAACQIQSATHEPLCILASCIFLLLTMEDETMGAIIPTMCFGKTRIGVLAGQG
jgi:hypothetical protein